MAEIELEKKWNVSDETAKTIGVRSSLAITLRHQMHFIKNLKLQQQCYAGYKEALEDLLCWMTQCGCFDGKKMLEYYDDIVKLKPEYTQQEHQDLMKLHDKLLLLIGKSGILYRVPPKMDSEDLFNA